MKMRYLYLAAIFAVFTSTARSAESVVKVPGKVPACQWFRIDARASTYTGTLRFFCRDTDIEVFYSTDGKEVLVYSPSPRQLDVYVVATDIPTTKESRPKASVAVASIEISGDGGGKLPVAPNVVDPANTLTGFPKVVWDKAMEIQHPDRKKQAKQLADNLQFVRDQIKDEKLDATKANGVVAAIRKQHSNLPKETHSTWIPWGKWWNGNLEKTWTAKKLGTKVEWLAILDDTILALNNVQ